MAPADPVVAMELAGALLQAGEAGRAAGLFEELGRGHATPGVWAGLATCALMLGDGAGARAALHRALQEGVADATVRALAGAVGAAWCGMSSAGVLYASVPGRVWVDGEEVRLAWRGGAARLPAGWRGRRGRWWWRGWRWAVRWRCAGSRGSRGSWSGGRGGFEGWAWSPADPGLDPELRIAGPGGAVAVTATLVAEGVEHPNPLARPRQFVVDVGGLGTPVTVVGPDGRGLLGSPVGEMEGRGGFGFERGVAPDGGGVLGSPAGGMEGRGGGGSGRGVTPDGGGVLGSPAGLQVGVGTVAGRVPVWADVVGEAPGAVPGRRAVDVVIPVYRGVDETLACLESVFAGVARGTRVIVVDDGTPEPALAAALDRLAARRRIVLLRDGRNVGFPGAANAGIRAAAGRDVLLLNSDTLVPPGFLGRMREAAYSGAGIGSVTPLSNDGTIVSVPSVAGGNDVPDLAGVVALDAVAWRGERGGGGGAAGGGGVLPLYAAGLPGCGGGRWTRRRSRRGMGRRTTGACGRGIWGGAAWRRRGFTSGMWGRRRSGRGGRRWCGGTRRCWSGCIRGMGRW